MLSRSRGRSLVSTSSDSIEWGIVGDQRRCRMGPGLSRFDTPEAKEAIMAQSPAALRINPAEETIQVGATRVHFLVTGEESHGSVVIFELTVAAEAKLPAPPHS